MILDFSALILIHLDKKKKEYWTSISHNMKINIGLSVLTRNLIYNNILIIIKLNDFNIKITLKLYHMNIKITVYNLCSI